MRLFILLSRLVKTSLRTLLGPAVSTTKATKRAFKKIRRAAATVEKTVEDLTDAAEKAASTATELSTHLAPAPVPAPIIVPSPATVTPTTRRETLVQEALATVARRRLYVARATDRNQLAAVYMSDNCQEHLDAFIADGPLERPLCGPSLRSFRRCKPCCCKRSASANDSVIAAAPIVVNTLVFSTLLETFRHGTVYGPHEDAIVADSSRQRPVVKMFKADLIRQCPHMNILKADSFRQRLNVQIFGGDLLR
ncbi:hypothetical protein VTJ04DRAFT_8989 [Mycothermus thermophilus]|uniref:uncharacterized protein n=1 Tax=Humicola insolens TaxID=85995 RepID=UPI003742FDB3